MDFGDSPNEAEFRARLRAWLDTNNPGLIAQNSWISAIATAARRSFWPTGSSDR